MPRGSGGRYKPPLPNTPSPLPWEGGVSVEFWVLIIGVVLSLVVVYGAYRFYTNKRMNSKAGSEETALHDVNRGAVRLTRLLKYTWTKAAVVFLDWHVLICSILLGV